MPTEIKRYVSPRIPTLGTPVVVVGINNDDAQKSLFYEIHIFLEAGVKFYRKCGVATDYEKAEQKQVADVIAATTQIVESEIEKIIIDEMTKKEIPINMFKKLSVVEQKDFTKFLYSLWLQGYETEIDNIAHKSQFERLRTEFTLITILPKLRINVTAD